MVEVASSSFTWFYLEDLGLIRETIVPYILLEQSNPSAKVRRYSELKFSLREKVGGRS